MVVVTVVLRACVGVEMLGIIVHREEQDGADGVYWCVRAHVCGGRARAGAGGVGLRRAGLVKMSVCLC